MWGIPPAVFDGTCALADEFWAQFRRYKMVNRTHDSMTKAYDRVLTALTYIRGPMINDWVNAQESHLLDHTDTTKPNHVMFPSDFIQPADTSDCLVHIFFLPYTEAHV